MYILRAMLAQMINYFTKTDLIKKGLRMVRPLFE